MKIKFRVMIQFLVIAIFLACKGERTQTEKISETLAVISSTHEESKVEQYNILELYRKHARSQFIPYKEETEDFDKNIQESIFKNYVKFFNAHDLKVILPYDYMLTKSNARELIYDEEEVKQIQAYNQILEQNHLDSIENIKRNYSAYLTTDIDYRYDDVQKKKVMSSARSNIIYKGENIATELISYNYENDEKIDRYEFTSKGFDYDYFIVESYGVQDERFSTLKLKPYATLGKYPKVPNYSPFSRMSNINSDGVYHLFGNENYELLIKNNKVLSLDIESTLKGKSNCKQFIRLLDNEYNNDILIHKDGNINEYNFHSNTYAKYRMWGEKDTIYYEIGTIKFDDICQSSNIEYDLHKTIKSSKLYEMVSTGELNYNKVLIEHKTYDSNGNLKNHKTYYKDGSLKRDISY